MRLRVVCGLEVTMAIFCPTRRFSSVDLPALGRPMMATKPERNPGFLASICACSCATIFKPLNLFRETSSDTNPDAARLGLRGVSVWCGDSQGLHFAIEMAALEPQS